MEDIKLYIESGILELYVLGDLAQEEKLEVERLAANYPEIQKELNEISKTMELFAEQNAIEPRESLRAEILDQLKTNTNAEQTFVPLSAQTDDKKVIPLQPVRQNYFYKYAFAASIALLLVSLVALFNTYNRLQESRQQLVALQLQNQKFANQVNYQENQINQYKQQAGKLPPPPPANTDSVQAKGSNSTQLIALQHQNQNFSNRLALQASELMRSKKKLAVLESENKKVLDVFSDPDSRFIKLKGTPFSPSSKLLIAWNPEKKQLWINKKASGLPVNDKDHQYQLWAIRKLKPISLGVFDIRKTDSIIERMASIDRAVAFAVTLEPRGGSEKPTLKQMMAIGVTHK